MARRPATVLPFEEYALKGLSDSALQAASSAAIFARGKTYAASGAVRMLDEKTDEPTQVAAEVAGTQTYSVEVSVQDGAVAGDCDCMNANDGWFCKQQVAVALLWRARLQGQTPVIDDTAARKVAASAKRAQKGARPTCCAAMPVTVGWRRHISCAARNWSAVPR